MDKTTVRVRAQNKTRAKAPNRVANKALLAWGLGLVLVLLARSGAASTEPEPAPAPAPADAAGSPGPALPAEPALIGPFEVASSDGRHRLRVGLSLQLRLTFTSADKGPDTARESSAELLARRLRPSLRGSFFGGRIESFIQLSTLPGSLELLDLYVNLARWSQLQLRLGQFKIPFTRYRTQLFSRLTFVEWAPAARYFGSERQLGLTLHNGYERPPRLAYELGIFSGTNSSRSFANGIATVYGEPLPNPSDLSQPALPVSLHPELVLHLAYNSPGVRTDSDHDEERGPLRASVGVSAAWDFSPVPYQEFAGRLSAELLLKRAGASLSAAAYAGWFQEPESGQLLPAMLAGVVQTAYALTPRTELALRYALLLPLKPLLDSARVHAAAVALMSMAARPQHAEQEHETTAGLNYYLAGHTLKLQADVSWLRHTRSAAVLDDARVRAQVQLVF